MDPETAAAPHTEVVKAPRKRLQPLRIELTRASVEIAFILFLFYANLLMGEFTRSHRSVSLLVALNDVITPANFKIGLIAAIVGYFAFEGIRREL